MLGGGQFDHLQTDPVCLGIRGGLLTRVALIHAGDLDRVAGRFLDFGGQFVHLCAFLLVGGRHQRSQQLAQGIDRQVHFGPFAPII
jgi:hypothetical protein